MEKMLQSYFTLLFNPRSIAFIGASNHVQKWGAIIFLNILLGGYPGRIYPVNPREETIFGHKAYPRVSEIPDPVDLAIIVIPADRAREAVLDCVRKGIGMAIVITSDFSETGEKGARLEKELVETARTAGMHLVGPNTMGIYSASCSLIAMMPAVRPKKGGVSLVSQSGNIGAQMLGQEEGYAVGFSKFVGSGNEGDLRAEDYLAFFGEDPETKVIMTYIEGLDDGRKFFDTARRITPLKPIIGLKGGKTPAGARAAKSHSGAMAGLNNLFEAAFRQAGILWASTTEEMLEMAAAFSSFPLPRGNRVGILTRGGGWGVITADACMEMGLEVPPLEKQLIRSLDQILPAYWSKGNPVDIVASTNTEDYLRSLEMLISSDKVDMVISLSGDAEPFTRILSEVKGGAKISVSVENLEEILQHVTAGKVQLHRRIRELMQTYRKPILATGPNRVNEQEDGDPDFSLPQFQTPERAAKVASQLYQYSRYRRAVGAM